MNWKIDCLMVEGHFRLAPGIMCYHTPGHTLGSMSLTVDTLNGTYVLTGDIAPLKCNLFPDKARMVLMDGTEIRITPAPKHLGPAIPPMLVNDHYDWLRSIYLLKMLCHDEELALPGHDPSLHGKVVS